MHSVFTGNKLEHFSDKVTPESELGGCNHLCSVALGQNDVPRTTSLMGTKHSLLPVQQHGGTCLLRSTYDIPIVAAFKRCQTLIERTVLLLCVRLQLSLNLLAHFVTHLVFLLTNLLTYAR